MCLQFRCDNNNFHFLDPMVNLPVHPASVYQFFLPNKFLNLSYLYRMSLRSGFLLYRMEGAAFEIPQRNVKRSFNAPDVVCKISHFLIISIYSLSYFSQSRKILRLRVRFIGSVSYFIGNPCKQKLRKKRHAKYSTTRKTKLFG